jgi:creatinine amidohydrolase
MEPSPFNLSTAKWKDVKDIKYQLAILPWGATEAHNYHLPFGTDTIETQHIALETARKANKKGVHVLVLPAIPYGVNTGQLDITGTINMNPSTQAFVVRDIVESLDQQSIPRLLILNGHGGNHFKSIIRELYQEYPETLMATIDWFRTGHPETFFEEVGDHAGEMETSIMMHIAGGIVLSLNDAGSGQSKAFRIQGFREGWAWTPREWTVVSKDTGIGDPSKASADKGGQYLEQLTSLLAGFVVEFATARRDNLFQ